MIISVLGRTGPCWVRVRISKLVRFLCINCLLNYVFPNTEILPLTLTLQNQIRSRTEIIPKNQPYLQNIFYLCFFMRSGEKGPKKVALWAHSKYDCKIKVT